MIPVSHHTGNHRFDGALLGASVTHCFDNVDAGRGLEVSLGRRLRLALRAVPRCSIEFSKSRRLIRAGFGIGAGRKPGSTICV